MRTWAIVGLLLLTATFVPAMDDITLLSEVPVSYQAGGAMYITDKIIVTMYEGTKPLEMNSTVAGYASTGHQEMDMLCRQNKVVKVEPWYPWPVKSDYLRSLVERMYILTVEDGLDVADLKDSFLAGKDVQFSDYYYLPVPTYVPDDPSINSQWALNKISAYGAWDLIRGDTTTNVVISINDTGVYYNHPDLRSNIWINGPEDINNNGVFDNYPQSSGGDLNDYDDDGNGYVDDVVGYDLGQNDPDPQEISPTHGTHVAGCASEATDNGVGGAGPGFWAKIHACKITNAAGQLTQGYQGIVYATDTGVDIINLSWGSPGYNSGNQNVCNYAHSMGVLIVAAAGNDDYWTPPYVNYPSAYNNVFAVASTDSDDRKSSFSNYGTWVDISAPGSYIYSTWAQSSYTNLSGTSMSSPIVAGAAALIKAQNPSATPDQIMNSLVGAADDIYDIQPQYEGQLGSGRLNIHSALGAANSPNIELLDYQVSLISDDGDGIANPGETVELAVVLENLWQDAHNTVLTLRAPAGLTVTDSISNLGTFPGNGEEMDNSSDPFVIDYDSDAVPGDYLLTLVISADGPYSVEKEIEIAISLTQENFPISLPNGVESSPLICDFDGDGANEVIVGCSDSKLYAIEADGSFSPGFPFNATDDVRNGAAVVDLDNDSDKEIVFTAENGDIYALSHQGNVLTGFPISTGGSIFATPSVGDLDGDLDMEIIQPNLQTKEIYVYHHDGTAFGNWPLVSDQGWYGGAALGDIDMNANLEIVIGGFDMKLHVYKADKTEVTGFPVTLDNRVWGTPAIGNIDPSDIEPEIVVASYSGSLYLINHDGSIVSGWPKALNANVKSSPSLGDFNNDGNPEIVIGTNSGELWLIGSNGEAFDGYPVDLEAGISASAVIADIDNNGYADIIIGNGSSHSYVYGFNSAGQPLANFPIPTSVVGQVNGTPSIWDLDRDGDLDIAVGIQNSGNNFEVIDYKTGASAASVQWSAFANDRHRSSNYDALGPVSVDDNVVLPSQFSLHQNYPNPFNSNTVIAYSLENPAVVTLDIYDILGRQVANLESGHRDAGIHQIIWNGKNNGGQDVSSGIYFYRLTAADQTSVKRMIYLR